MDTPIWVHTLICVIPAIYCIHSSLQNTSSSSGSGGGGSEDGSGENYAANTGTIGRQGLSAMLPGAGDMMSEMAKKLQERRRRADEGVSATGVRR